MGDNSVLNANIYYATIIPNYPAWESFVIKTLILAFVLLSPAHTLFAAPPNPDTFVPNRAAKPSQILAVYMKNNISKGIRDVIYIWNRSYSDPSKQIVDLMKIFKYFSNSPVVPKQMLMNEEFELKRVLDTKKMLKALDRFQKELNTTHRALFEYISLIIGSKQGDIEKAYKKVLKEMKHMVKGYNRLAKVTNQQYRQKVMPYYALNYKKRK
jgi:hypothetical protein